MNRFAFVILSHNNPGQLLRLTQTLSRLYNDPCIVCHHNFTMCPLDEDNFPANCEFLHPHIDSRWGDISLVKAGLLAIERLHQVGGWDWFFLLSGSDYPIAEPESIARELSSANFDAILYDRLIEYDQYADKGPDAKGEFGFSRQCWPSLGYDRYLTYRMSYPSLTRRLRPTKRSATIRNPILLRMLGKWPINFKVYGGELWCGGNRRTAEVLANHPKQRSILQFFNSKQVVEEAVYHTIIRNSDLKVGDFGSRRFSKWPERSAHPKWLAEEDYIDIINSGSWFARKFLPDDPVLDRLDEHLGLTASDLSPLPIRR